MDDTIATLVPLLGRALLHFLWQGALIGLLAVLALQLLRDARPQVRYAVACGALLACVLAPVAWLAWQWLAGAGIDAGVATTATLVAADAATASPVAGSAWSPATGVLLPLEPSLPWIVALWAAGACTLSLRLAAGVWWIGMLPSLPMVHVQRHWQARLDALSLRFGLARQPALRLVEALDSPVVVGCWRPLVLLPLSLLARLPADYLDALLAHELAHVRRHDYLVNLLQGLAEALLFYHPVTWWLSRRIRIEREHVADRLAAEAIGDPRRLALALSALADAQAALQSAPQPALAALSHSGGPLMKRIEQLVRPGRAASAGRLVFPLLGLAAAGLAFYAHANRDPAASPVGMSVFNTIPSSSASAASSPAAVARKPGVVATVAQAPAASTARTPNAQIAPAAAQAARPSTAATPAAHAATVSSAAMPAPPAPPAPPVPVRPGDVAAPPPPPPPPRATSVPAPPAPPAPARPLDVLAPPAPPAPPALTSNIRGRRMGSQGEPYALVSQGRDIYLMSGSSDNLVQIEAMRRSAGGDFLWFRRDGNAYVVTDPATVAQVRKSWAQADALGERMEGLGGKMEAHGRKMEAIGHEMEQVSEAATPPAGIDAASRQMEALGLQQGQLGERQARLALAMREADERQRASLERQMQALANEQEALSRKMEAQSRQIEAEVQRHQHQLQPMEAMSRRMEEASRPMEALGQQMEGLGKQMEIVTERAERDTRQQIDRALAQGLAKPVPQRQ
jgi:beta-lactamase regulating signal transducer with metallopeptidase domain